MSKSEPISSKASPQDVATPNSLVTAVYGVISGPAERERDWDRFRALFLPEARLIISAKTPEGATHFKEYKVEDFIAEAGKFYREKGFWEREIAERTEQFGNIAHVFSTYESRFGTEESPPIGRGINSVQAINIDERWWIANLIWDVEQSQNPIPEHYLP